MLKNKKGITLVTLVITIVIILILTTTTLTISFSRFEYNKYRKLIVDLELLENKVSNYYLMYNGLPVLRDDESNPIEYTQTLEFSESSSDNSNYYIIDLSALTDITLNYGKDGFDNPNESDDVYIINEESHAIYYVRGIEYKGITYYCLSQINVDGSGISSTKPQIKVVEGNLQYDDENAEYYSGPVTLEFIPGKSLFNNIEETNYLIEDITNSSTGVEIASGDDISELTNNMYTTPNKNKKIRITLTTIDGEENESVFSQEFTIKTARIEPKSTTAVYASLEQNDDGNETYTLVFTDEENSGENIIDCHLVTAANHNVKNTTREWVTGGTNYSTKITKAEIRDCIKPSFSIKDMFNGLTNLTEIEHLDYLFTSEVKVMTAVFMNCSKLEEIDLTYLDTSKVNNMLQMFQGCSTLKNLYLDNFDTKNVSNMKSMFRLCSALENIEFGSKFVTSNVTDMSVMFSECANLEKIDLSKFNTSKVTTMEKMFRYCYALKELDVSDFDTSKVKVMSEVFQGCSKLESIDVTNFNTSSANTLDAMFYDCSNLKELDISNFNTSSVTTMENLFMKCSNLTELDLSNFNTSNVTSMNKMFYGCSSLINLDLSNFNTSNVTNMNSMFYNCTNLANLTINNFDTSKVTDIYAMFYGCQNVYTEITIRNPGITSYGNIFKNNAAKNGKISVNYTNETSTLVDTLITVKSSASNVVKGNLVT